MSRIIVKNLPSTITEKKLRGVFEEKGHITDLQLKYNKAGVFRKFAFVGYKTEEEAKAAKEYFNNTFIFTSKVQIEICSNLNDPNRPKAWKEFLKEKAEKTKLSELKKESPTKDKNIKAKNSSISEDATIPDELKNDPKFKEFLAIHEDRRSKPLWADDVGEFEQDGNKSQSSGEEDEDEDDGYNTAQKDEAKHEENSTTEKESQNKVKEISPKKEVKTDQEITDKKIKIYDDLYTVKLRNLPYRCKKKQIKELFHPLKITSLRIPQKNKGFAYVSFKTEKDRNIALNKHRGYLSGHRIDVVKYTRKDTFECKKQNQQAENEEKVDLELLAETGRIYVRNLCFSVTESELEELFSKYGPLAEVYLPLDRMTKQAQGFAFISYLFAEHAVKAFSELDGTVFQGRLLHLIPAQPKKEFKIDENETNYKKKKDAKIKALSGSSHNWNILFMGMNAVADVIAEKYNVEKSKLLSGDSKESVAVRMALAETQVVLETRKFLIENGVQLDAFSQAAAERSKTVIVVKHLPAKTSAEEVNETFSKYGIIKRVVLPPSGMVALVEFEDPSEAKVAFKKLAYTRFKHLPLYLEWAPVDSLKDPPAKEKNDELAIKEKEDLPLQEETQDDMDEPPPGTTIFVKNINFSTTQESFIKHFQQCGTIHYAAISTKKDIRTGKLLSMGFGFVQYKEKSAAVKAVERLQLSKLDGHSLEVKFANRAVIPSAPTRKKKYEVKKQLTAKILVKNLPFEASEKEVRELFSQFGIIKFVRLPKKMGERDEHRGFCFVEYMTKSDAKRAFDALCHSTHLFGRRLVLEWANPESEDINEIRKKTARDFADSGPKTKVKKSKLREDVALASSRSRPVEE